MSISERQQILAWTRAFVAALRSLPDGAETIDEQTDYAIDTANKEANQWINRDA